MINRFANYLLCFTLLLVLASGCKPLEVRCLERFPTERVTEVRKDTLVDTLILPDTWVEYVDTTYCPPGLTDTLEIIKTRTVQLPGDTIVREYYCTDTVTVVRDSERLIWLERDRVSLEASLDRAKRLTRSYTWVIVLMVALILALFALLVKRR